MRRTNGRAGLWTGLWGVAAALMTALVFGDAGNGDRPPPPSPDQIRKWVEDLGDGRYSVREEATAKLKEAGPAAKPLLEKAASSDDPEVKNRAQEVLEYLTRSERLRDLAWLGLELAEGLVANQASIQPLTPDQKLRLGVSMMHVVPDLAERVKVEKGVLLAQIQKGSAAERAGLRQWDLVLRFGGREVGTTEELLLAVREAQTGKRLVAEVARLTDHGRRLEVEVVLGEPVEPAPEEPPLDPFDGLEEPEMR